MALPWISRVPETPEEWARFHWYHYQAHRLIQSKIFAVTGVVQYMPPIWPVPANQFTPILAKWHQDLHTTLNAVDGVGGNDMSQADLRTREGQQAFINQNFREHQIWDQVMGQAT